MPIPCIRIDLTDEQIVRLEPVQSKVRQAANTETPGMMLAQIFGNTMRVFFADGTQARAIQAAMGSTVGRTSDGLVVTIQ